MSLRNKITALNLLLLLSVVFSSCYRKDIQFGNVPEDSYSRLVYVDTVEARLSTVLTDSFATNAPASFLIGKYKDPYLGIISAKPFFQMAIPSGVTSLTIPVTAHYDSTCIIIYLNKYYYGDTTKSITLHANELALPIDYSYSTNLYNTSSVPEKPTALGSQSLKIRPSVDDSVMIRINDSKGVELFNKLQGQANEITSQANFQNYFNGISLSVNSNDTSVVYGLNSTSGKIIMRVFYHLTTPSYQSQVVDFTSLNNTYAFNQIVTDRTGTQLYSAAGIKEFPSEQTNDIAFTQHGAGVLMKVTFPSLKGILQSSNTVKLLKADLLIKPVGQSYNSFLKLPSSLILARTDATNTIGSQLSDASGSSALVVQPVIDEIYGVDTYYLFTVTSYVNVLLTTAGSETNGFFLMEHPTDLQVNRAVIGNEHSSYRTQLLLTIAIINK